MIVEFIILLGIALYIFYKWSTAGFDYFEKMGIPYDKPFPLFGSQKDIILRKVSMYDNINNLYKQFNTSLSGLFDQRIPAIIIRDPALLKRITIKDFDHFVNHRTIFTDKDGGLFGNALNNMQNEKWKNMRSTLSPVFTGSKMRQMFVLINEVADESMKFLKKDGQTEIDFNIKDYFTRFTNDVIASAVFGLKINSFTNEDNEFYTMGKKVTKFSTWQTLKFLLFTNFKSVMRAFKVTLFDQKDMDYFTRLVMDTMKYRQEYKIMRPDLINMMMEVKGMSIDKKPDEKSVVTKEWSDDEIVAQFFVFFFAGFEPTAVLMAFVSHELMVNPDVQERLRQEILEVKDNLNGKPLTYEILQGMKYMDMVVSETLRRWPPAVVTDRECNKDFHYKDDEIDITIKAGQHIWIPIVGYHLDEKYYPDPLKFDPERFNDENKTNITPFTYLPFGVGPRNCIDEFSESSIREFFKNQSVFLTGATGFLGKVIMEKLLRTTDVKMVYILIRKKRDKDIKERVADVFEDPLFQVLHRERRDFLMRVHPIVGDCSLPHLGISKVDQQLLKENASVVIHSAATVRFIEPLKNALEINVRATLALIELAKEMDNIKSFLHVSSAFANCNRPHIDEVFYNAGISGENACLLAELLSPEVLDKISSKLIGNFPNTYTYTKALAEEIILMNGKELPLCVFRPGIVIPTYKDPVPGWIDNLYGPTSILIGAATGVLRVLYARMSQNAAVVPVDYCANAILACSWHTAKNHATIPPIYNFVPDQENLVQWEAYRTSALTDGVKMPFTRMLWYPTLTVTESKTWFSILCFFYHIIPAMIFDFCLILMGRKRRMLKMYKKIHKSCSLLNYFAENDWTFTCDNIKKIWAKLPETDHEMYPFDMRQIEWSRQFYHSMCGVRRYLAKEEPKTIPKGIKLLRRLRILHSAMLLTLYGSGICLLLMFVFKAFFDK